MLRLSGFDRLLFWSPFALLNAILKGKHFPQGALRIHSGKLWSKYVGTVLVAWENSQQFRDATTGFPAKWRRRNERRNSILMTRYYPDVGCASDWMKQISTSIEFLHLLFQTSCRRETSSGIAKCWLFSQVTVLVARQYKSKPCTRSPTMSSNSGVSSKTRKLCAAREPASFWRENVKAVVILLHVSAKMSHRSDGNKPCQLSNVGKFYHFALGRGLNLLQLKRTCY